MQEQLLELVGKYKKNSKLSMTDKEKFERELALELGRNEYSEDIEVVLCEGPIQSSMRTFAQYMAHVDTVVAKGLLMPFISGKRIKENKGGLSGLRIVPLCSYYIEQKKDQDEIAEELFLSSVRFSYKNEKNDFNKKVVEEVRKTLVPVILKHEQNFNLKFITDNRTWYSTRNLMMESVLQGKKINYSEVEKLHRWLTSSDRDMGKYDDEFLLERIQKNEQARKNDGEIAEDLSESEKNNFRQESDKKTQGVNNVRAATNNSDQDILASIGKVVLAETRMISKLMNAQEELTRKFETLSVKLHKAQIKEEQQSSAISELVDEKHLLQEQNAEYIETVEKLEKMIANLQSEVKDQKQFSDTISRNREKKSEEFLNRLASKLKIDYQDYCDARDLDMTIDLGENMREQLGEIFSILKKNGINFD